MNRHPGVNIQRIEFGQVLIARTRGLLSLAPETPEEMREICFEIGMVGKHGLDINDPKSYSTYMRLLQKISQDLRPIACISENLLRPIGKLGGTGGTDWIKCLLIIVFLSR